ncbi:MAG: hypothetical protein ABWZ66_03270 [Pyrinomonadaceae bacterium]
MICLKKLLFAMGLTVFLASFSFVSAQSSPDLNLSGASLKRQQSFTFNPRFTAAQSGRIEEDYFPREVKPQISRSRDSVANFQALNKAQVVAQNTGAKTIKAITWEYSFYSDAQMSQVLKSYRIYSKKQIRAGETKIIRGEIETPVNLQTQYKKVRAVSIEYTDGTVWQDS